MNENPYAALPDSGPNEVTIGSGLVLLVEPHPGHEREYNRWYEDDHYYAGGMASPWVFAGRRWVATRDLQLLRYPADSPAIQPVTRGCYLTLFWITAGRRDDFQAWAGATV